MSGRSGSKLGVKAAQGRSIARQGQANPALLHGLLWASVLLNFVLCFVDTNLVRVGSSLVIAGEAVILAAAIALPFAYGDRRPGRFDLLLIALFANWVLLSLLRQVAEPKYFRDVAIIPIFIIVGMACRGDKLHISIARLHILIFAFALWEAISVSSFTHVFNVSSYFAHTRGLSPDDWWIENGLYISSVRPEARFLFPGLPVHRLSSVFLEPVSLGNYVVIATLWLIGFWRHIPRKLAIIAAIANVLLLIGCDSRLATVACLVLVLAAPFKKHLWSGTALLMAPAVIFATFLAVWLLDLHAGTDDFPGRMAYAVGTLQSFDVQDLAGISLRLIRKTEDAGFAYLINSQSLIMATLLWVFVFARRLVTPESRYVHFAVALYLSLNLIVSWSLFSIKTSALLWFLLGRMIATDREAAQGSTSKNSAKDKRHPQDIPKPTFARMHARYRN